MKAPTLLCISLIILFEVHARNLNPGSKDINESESASASELVSSKAKTSQVPLQKVKKRYATKEVILYLTPSQIEALQAGKGLISPQSLPELMNQEEQDSQDQKLQEQTEFVKQEFENLKSAIIEVEPPNEENVELRSQEPLLQREILSIENQQQFNDQWRQEQSNQDELLKLLNLYIELKKAEQLNSQKEEKYNRESNAWLTHSSNIPKNEIVPRNQIQLIGLSSLPVYDQNSENIRSQTVKPLLQLQYSPRYNDQKKAIEIETILRTRHHHELEKQSALVQAEKISNSLVDDQLKFMQQNPVPVVNHVKVPISIPVLVSGPEPVPVNGPYPYRLLEEVIRHIRPVPIGQREFVINKAVPYDRERQITVPFSRTVLLNVHRPNLDQKFVPVEIKRWS